MSRSRFSPMSVGGGSTLMMAEEDLSLGDFTALSTMHEADSPSLTPPVGTISKRSIQQRGMRGRMYPDPNAYSSNLSSSTTGLDSGSSGLEDLTSGSGSGSHVDHSDDPSHFSSYLHPLSPLGDTTFAGGHRPSSRSSTSTPTPRASASASASDIASASRAAFFTRNLERRYTSNSMSADIRDRVHPLPKEVVIDKRLRIQQIEKRIEQLRRSRQRKVQRVQTSLQQVQTSYEVLRETTKEVGSKGSELNEALREIQHRVMQQQAQDEAMDRLFHAQQALQAPTTTSAGYGALDSDLKPQTAMRPFHSPPPKELIVAENGPARAAHRPIRPSSSDPSSSPLPSSPSSADVHSSISLSAAAVPSPHPSQLRSCPLPPGPKVLDRVRQQLSAASSSSAGNMLVDRKVYGVMDGIERWERERAREKRLREEALERGVNPTDPPEKQKAWVDKHVFHVGDPDEDSKNQAHGHTFPATERTPLEALLAKQCELGEQYPRLTLHHEKQRFSALFRKVIPEWSRLHRAQQHDSVKTLADLSAQIHQAKHMRDRAQQQFENERILGVEMLRQSRTLAALRKASLIEAKAREEFRRRMSRMVQRVQQEEIWMKVDAGQQVEQMIEEMGKIPSYIREQIDQATIGHGLGHAPTGHVHPGSMRTGRDPETEAFLRPDFEPHAYLAQHPSLVNRAHAGAAPFLPAALPIAQTNTVQSKYGWRDDLWETKEFSPPPPPDMSVHLKRRTSGTATPQRTQPHTPSPTLSRKGTLSRPSSLSRRTPTQLPSGVEIEDEDPSQIDNDAEAEEDNARIQSPSRRSSAMRSSTPHTQPDMSSSPRLPSSSPVATSATADSSSAGTMGTPSNEQAQALGDQGAPAPQGHTPALTSKQQSRRPSQQSQTHGHDEETLSQQKKQQASPHAVELPSTRVSRPSPSFAPVPSPVQSTSPKLLPRPSSLPTRPSTSSMVGDVDRTVGAGVGPDPARRASSLTASSSASSPSPFLHSSSPPAPVAASSASAALVSPGGSMTSAGMGPGTDSFASLFASITNFGMDSAAPSAEASPRVDMDQRNMDRERSRMAKEQDRDRDTDVQAPIEITLTRVDDDTDESTPVPTTVGLPATRISAGSARSLTQSNIAPHSSPLHASTASHSFSMHRVSEGDDEDMMDASDPMMGGVDSFAVEGDFYDPHPRHTAYS